MAAKKGATVAEETLVEPLGELMGRFRAAADAYALSRANAIDLTSKAATARDGAASDQAVLEAVRNELILALRQTPSDG